MNEWDEMAVNNADPDGQHTSDIDEMFTNGDYVPPNEDESDEVPEGNEEDS